MDRVADPRPPSSGMILFHLLPINGNHFIIDCVYLTFAARHVRADRAFTSFGIPAKIFKRSDPPSEGAPRRKRNRQARSSSSGTSFIYSCPLFMHSSLSTLTFIHLSGHGMEGSAGTRGGEILVRPQETHASAVPCLDIVPYVSPS
jgi:hypothetical protein